MCVTKIAIAVDSAVKAMIVETARSKQETP